MSETTDWRDDAACLDQDPETMTPEVATPSEVEAALRLCNRCPVRDECTALAEGQPNAYGVHGGKWYGDPPRNPETHPCQWCEKDTGSSQASYCGGACRTAAWRARTAVSA